MFCEGIRKLIQKPNTSHAGHLGREKNGGKKHRLNRPLSSHATPPAFLSTPTLTDADNGKDIDKGDSLAVGE